MQISILTREMAMELARSPEQAERDAVTQKQLRDAHILECERVFRLAHEQEREKASRA